MSNDPLNPQPSGSEESWETMSEDLFGIDFEEMPDSEEIVLPEPTLAEEVEAAGEDEHPHAIDDEHPHAVDAVETASGGEAQSLATSPPTDSDQSFEADDSFDELDELAPAEDGLAPNKEDETGARSDENDTYWDALNDWEWNDQAGVKSVESTEAPPSRQGGRIGGRDRGRSTGSRESAKQSSKAESSNAPIKEKDDFLTAADWREEYSDDADFGSGLFDSDDEKQASAGEDEPGSVDDAVVQTGSPTSESEPELIEESGEAAADSTGRKRRRRRRRPRQQKEKPADTSAAEVSTDGTDDFDRETSFVSDEASEAEPPQSRRQSQPGRPSSTQSTTDDDLTESDVVDDGDLEFLDDDDEQEVTQRSEEDERTPTYRDVPTWEEAISYLLMPGSSGQSASDSKTKTATKPRTSRPRGSRSGSGPSDSESPKPRGRGRRGGRRRRPGGSGSSSGSGESS